MNNNESENEINEKLEFAPESDPDFAKILQTDEFGGVLVSLIPRDDDKFILEVVVHLDEESTSSFFMEFPDSDAGWHNAVTQYNEINDSTIIAFLEDRKRDTQ